MIIAGLDYSYTSPAVCIFNCSGDYKIYGIRAKKKQESSNKNLILLDYPEYKAGDQMDRFDKLSTLFIDVIIAQGVQKVFLEGYAYAGAGNTFDIGEATGIMKYKLKLLGIEVEIIPPTVVKKFATGKGNANKLSMLEFFCQQNDHKIKIQDIEEKDFTTNIPKPLDDIVDAYWLCRYGITHQLQIASMIQHL